MTKYIDKLTAAQEAALPKHIEKWYNYAISTKPSEFNEAEELIKKCYEFSNLKVPKFVFEVDSPVAMAIIGPTLLNFSEKELSALPRKLHEKIPAIDKVATTKVGKKVIKDNWKNYISGNNNISWPAIESFYREVCGLELPDNKSEIGKTYSNIAKYIGWWYPAENYFVMVNRPIGLHLENGVLHSPNGYAIEWADGKGICAWRGTVIPNDWMMVGMPKPEVLLHWPNIEQRRAGCEIFGWHNVIDSLNPKVINEDADPLIGTLIEVDLPDSGKERFLRVLCGTGRTFCIPVSPDCNTALEANLRTYGIDDLTMKPEVRT